MNIDDAFREITNKHGLIVLSLNLQHYSTGSSHFTAMAHWSVPDAATGQECASGEGETAAAAITNAIQRANDKRAKPIAVPALELSDAN